MNASDRHFVSHGTRCAATYVTSAGAALTSAAGRPCVVMGHGFGATRDAGLRPFADRFAAAGADVLMFDYRGFGTSDGTPRQDVSHWRHRADYHSAITYARSLPDVDPARIVLWGSSYSGGHVLPVAVKDGRVAAVISQGAAMDGLAALLEIARYAGVGQLLKLTRHSLRDLARACAGGPLTWYRSSGLRGHWRRSPLRAPRSDTRRSWARHSATRCAPAASCSSH